MPGIRLAALVQRLRRDATPDAGECADGALVARFAATRDEAAFELLVRRHGAMVLATCQRVLGHTEDAEDAFQAAFLVLARKAASVRRGTAVPAWLHRVAVRIARRAADRRQPTTTLVAEPPARPTPDAAERSELRGLLDAEIDRLSEPFRRAFVLCYLEGLSNADAAQVLGCPVGTVESRLTAARRKLRGRLARRIELSAGILALLACPPGLSADTVATLTRAGVMSAQRGLRATIGIVREPAVRLAEGGIRAMTKTMRVWAAVVLIGLVAGVGWANRPADPLAEPAVAADPLAVAPAPTPVREQAAKADGWPLAEQLEENRAGYLRGISPDGKSLILTTADSVRGVSLVGKSLWINIHSQNKVSAAAVSPDGKYVATAEGENGVKLRDAASGRVIEALWPRGDLPALDVAFTPDGTKLVALCSRHDNINNKAQEVTQLTRVSVWDLTTRKEVGHPVQSDTSDWETTLPSYVLTGYGRFVLKHATIFEGEAGPKVRALKGYRFSLIDAVSGKEGKSIEVDGATFETIQPDPVSPDGKTLVRGRSLLVFEARSPNPVSPDGKTLVLRNFVPNELRFLDTETGKDRFPVAAFRRPVKAFVFSPDGRFMAAATGKSANGTDSVAAPSEVVIWDAATGRELARLTDKETIRDYVALAFSPDGSFLAAQTKSPPLSITIWGRLPTPDPEPEPVKPVAKVPEAVAAPARFQALIRDLSGKGVTDARRVEAMFLAALGRFPTDVEARTLAAQLARRDDKAAALRDLLGTLTETNEFRTHAEELGRLAK